MSATPAFTIYRIGPNDVMIGVPITIYADGRVLGIDGSFTIVNRIPQRMAEVEKRAFDEGLARGKEIASKISAVGAAGGLGRDDTKRSERFSATKVSGNITPERAEKLFADTDKIFDGFFRRLFR